MRLFILAAIAVLSAAGFVAYNRVHAESDLSTVAGVDKTCAVSVDARLLQSNQQRQAFAICRDIRLVQNIVTFVTRYRNVPLGQLTDEQARKIVLDQLTHIRDELRASRLALETIALAPGEGLKLMPSEWQIDLNRNGEIEAWEKYFFTIQKHGGSSFAFNIPNDSKEYYRGESLLSAVIQVDSSDIAWSLSYHYFIESLVEMVLA